LHEPLDVEAVEDERCLGHSVGDGLDVRRGHVDGDRLELRAPRGAELVEERLECLGILAALGPDDALARVVDDDRDVLVVASVRQLIDPDVRQVVEFVADLAACDHALEDVADRDPADAQQVADRRLVAALGEAPNVVLERPREPRAGLGPRDLLHLDATSWALDPTDVVAQMQQHPADVEMAPAATAISVVARTALPAARAAPAPPGRRHVHDEPLVVERRIKHPGLFQTQHGTE
jgi:hypothetical protein